MSLKHRICITSLLRKPSVLLQVLIIIERVDLGLRHTHKIVMYSTYLRTVIAHFGHRYLKIAGFVLTDKTSYNYLFVTSQMQVRYSSFFISVPYSKGFCPF